jgi:hypothetical protein
MPPSGLAADCLMTLEYDMYGGYQHGQLLLKVVSRLLGILKLLAQLCWQCCRSFPAPYLTATELWDLPQHCDAKQLPHRVW